MLADYRRMDDEDLVVRFRTEIYQDDLSDTVGFDQGHTKDLHINQTDGQLISRIVSHDALDHAEYSSCFYDTTTAEDMISFACYRQAENILNWVRHTHDNTFIFTADMGEGEMIGRGFDPQFQERESSVARIVLQRDPLTRYGFYVKTAYVDVTCPEAELTGVTYSHAQVAALDEVEFESPMEETAYSYQDVFPDVQIRYGIDRNHEEYLKISYTKENLDSINIFVTNNDVKVKHKVAGDSTHRLQLSDLESEKRDMVGVIQEMIKLKTIQKEQKQNIKLDHISRSDDLER